MHLPRVGACFRWGEESKFSRTVCSSQFAVRSGTTSLPFFANNFRFSQPLPRSGHTSVSAYNVLLTYWAGECVVIYRFMLLILLWAYSVAWQNHWIICSRPRATRNSRCRDIDEVDRIAVNLWSFGCDVSWDAIGWVWCTLTCFLISITSNKK